ncbi:hypothetical protein K1719_014158 [Acacia pycnantha]|nr:hypothetical protein K1719_014158 [Acacia pycnantha]
MKAKEKEGKATNALVGQPVILSQSSDGYNLRPNGLSSVRNMKKAARAHNVIFGSTKTIEISKVSEAKEQAEREKKNFEKKDIVDIVPCNLDIVNSSTITIKNGKNDDVDRGAEDSEAVPPSLPPDELIEHIVDDADFTEGQESLVSETQFEMGMNLDSGHASTDPVRDQDHDVALMEQNQLSHDQWDPNEDIAPAFLEDNRTIVPETHPLHLNGGDIE